MSDTNEGSFAEKESNQLKMLEKKIEETRELVDNKCADLQKKIQELEIHHDEDLQAIDKILTRFSSLIIETMDHVQRVVTVIGELQRRLNENGQNDLVLKNSIAINKHNLNELSKYTKKIGAAWKEACAELDALKTESSIDSKFRWKVSAAFGLITSAVTWLLMSGNASALWHTIVCFFTGSK